jgi:hypothetical protein
VASNVRSYHSGRRGIYVNAAFTEMKHKFLKGRPSNEGGGGHK